MDRTEKVARLMTQNGVEDERRLALDEFDSIARRNGTWGSKEHRGAREKTEARYDATRRSYEAMSEQDLDRALTPKES